jgi:hypothetical protein
MEGRSSARGPGNAGLTDRWCGIRSILSELRRTPSTRSSIAPVRCRRGPGGRAEALLAHGVRQIAPLTTPLRKILRRRFVWDAARGFRR